MVEPSISPQFEAVPLTSESQVLLAWMSASSQVHSFKKVVVIRQGDKVTEASVAQVAELAQRKAHLDWLDQAVSWGNHQ